MYGGWAENFARNEVCEWLRKMLFFSLKNEAQRKKFFSLSFAKITQKFCEWKPYINPHHTIME